MKLIDKDALVAEIEKRLDELYNLLPDASKVENGTITISEACNTGKYTALESFKIYIDTLEVKEVQEEPVSKPNEQLAENYLAMFDKKFPILPTLKGKQLADYKNFLNKCQQIFGLKEWGIHPIQSKLFERLTLLWATWGAEHLQGVGRQDEKEQDIPVSEDLEKAAVEAFKQIVDSDKNNFLEIFKAGAKWQKEHLWKPAEGPDLPIIDREVIALLDNGKVVFAHRPPEYWDGKDIVTGKITRNYPKTYDKGGWNIPNVKYWLDVELPKETEP